MRSAARTFPGWLILLGMLTAIGPLSVDMYLPSFPTIARGLGSDTGHVQLTLASFLVGMALGQLVYGPLSDRFGRKPPLYAGLAIYVLASVACALAPSVTTLTLARFLQALGGSAGVVISRAVIRDRTTVEQGARAFSLLMLVMGLAPILAPLLGGLVLTVAGWRAIFAVLAVFGALLLVLVHRKMGETVSRAAATPLSLGVALRGYGRLLRDRRLVACTLAGGLAYAGMFAYIAGSPYVLIELYGVPAEHFGWLFGLNALGLIACSQFNARHVIRQGPAPLLKRAIVVPPFAALFALVPALLGLRSVTLLMLGLFVYMASLGFIGPNSTALALAEQGKRAGSAAALMGTLQFLLGTLAGVAVSVWQTPSAVPLAAVMLVFGAGGWLVHRRWVN